MITPKLIRNENGPTLGVYELPILEIDGLYFKDFERNGVLAPYADWRLPAEQRAADLAARLSVEEMAGQMLYSPHQMVPAIPGAPFSATYDGKSWPESGKAPWAMSDQQYTLLTRNHVRHVLAVKYKDADTAARWTNELQAFCEALPHSLPVSISSDPRHGAGGADAEYKSEGSDVSKWPEGLAMGATFDLEVCRQFARVMADEYRALGITTALSPQVDLGTEPRWMRVGDTFGTHPQLVADMAKAYCDALQTDPDAQGWGKRSVAAMAKHWPGGGSCEGGRDAHYAFGKYAVYPGGRLNDHLLPFLQGAFDLPSGTGAAAAVMPYYTISWQLDPSGQNVGNSYSKYLIHDLLREKYGYQGVICTDWSITGDPKPDMDSFGDRSYGVEHLTKANRHLRIIENGVDQFGGNSEIEPILEAYRIGCVRYGEAAMRARFEQSAARLLTVAFRCGLFENPYLEPAASIATVGSSKNQAEGFAAQLKSVVMLKNNGVLPLTDRLKAYVPKRMIAARKNFVRMLIPGEVLPGAPRAVIEEYFDWVDDSKDADVALCFIESPMSDGYDGALGYLPISLQYRPYKAEAARETSIAGGDFREASANRSYRGKVGTAANEHDLDIVLEARRAMGSKPVIVCIRMQHPCVLSELEPSADAILVDFGVQKKALLEIITGKAEPSGLLPVQLPANMETVERHGEDTPLDLEPYIDSAGHCYDFAYGLNWSGQIQDDRVNKYKR